MMSGLPLAMLGRTLPIVLLRTHYGRVWFVRLGALVMLWIGWGLGRRPRYTQIIPAGMLVAGGLIALTRSLSGHAADWGDMTLAVMLDGLHLFAGGLWGGGLLALTCIVLPAVSKCANQRSLLLAALARRFATLASMALAVVLLTGLANAWVQVGTMRALWATPYGRTLLAKLFLVGLVILLGSVNHYFYVPLLQQQAGRPTTGAWLWHAPGLWQLLPSGWKTLVGSQVARHWWRTVVVESLLLIGVLLCTVLLLQAPPARSSSRATHEHVGTTSTSVMSHDHR
jgi:putative copper export protein